LDISEIQIVIPVITNKKKDDLDGVGRIYGDILLSFPTENCENMDGRRSSKKDSTDTPPTISEVLSAVDSLHYDLNKRLDEIEKHLSAIDDRVNKLSNSISAIDDIEKSLTSIDEQVSDLTQRVQAVELKCTSTKDTTDEIAVVKQDINKARRAINDNE